MKKVLIAGGAGFIGSNLTTFHLQKNDFVFVIDNLITGNKKNIQGFFSHQNFKFLKKDIQKLTINDLPYSQFDIFYHLASPASPIQYQKHPLETIFANVFGTKNLLDLFLKTKSKVFIFSSTSEIYGDPLVHPQKEDYFGNVNPLGERACYDESKRLAETLIINYYRQFKCDLRIARIFNTYGPNMEKDDGRVISNFIYQALKNKPLTIFGNGQQTRSLCYVDDMVEGLYLLAQKNNLAGEVFNLGNPDERKIIDLAYLIKKLTQSSSKIVFLPKKNDDPRKRKPDIKKAKEILKWNPKIKLEEGLKKTISYFKTHFI